MALNSARDFLIKWFGDSLVSNLNEADFTVGVAVAQIATRDGAAIARQISNNGTGTIFVSSKSAVAVNKGMMIAVGDTLSLFILEDFDLAWCDLFAISAVAGNPVHVVTTQLVGG